MKKKVGEENARHMINMMRSIATNLPISPFHLAAADDMESLLNEVLLYRKRKWVELNEEETTDLIQKWSGELVFEVTQALKEKNGN